MTSSVRRLGRGKRLKIRMLVARRLHYRGMVAKQAETRKLVETDAVMATVVERYALARDQKALVFCGYAHAFSGFEQPVARDGQVVRVDDARMGNLLRSRYGDRVCTVLLHAPWPGLTPDLLSVILGNLQLLQRHVLPPPPPPTRQSALEP